MPRKAAPRRQTRRPFGYDEAVEQMLERVGAGEGTKARAKADRKARKRITRVLERGGTLAALDDELERLMRRWKAEDTSSGVYAQHRASVPPKRATASATRPARATLPLAPADESPRPGRKRRGAPAGFVGYIDPRLFDSDDLDD